jgi:hypothetical protein
MCVKSRFLLPILLCGFSVSSLAQLQSPQVSPRVVAQVSQTGLTKSVSRTLFTPQKDGLFRLSFYVLPTASTNGLGNVNFSVTSVNDVGPAEQGAGCGANVSPAVCTFVFVVRAKAGTPIGWHTLLNNGAEGNTTYDVFATLEKLQPLQ